MIKALDSLRDSERLHAWVCRTARGAIVDLDRSAAIRREIASGDAIDLAEGMPHGTTDTADGDEGAAFRELAACLPPMLAQLAPAYRDALTLTGIEGHNPLARDHAIVNRR